MADEHEHLVLVDQLLRGSDALCLVASIVGEHRLEFAPVDAAVIVDRAEVGLRPIIQRVEHGALAGERPKIADLYGRGRDPLGVVRARCRRHRRHQHDRRGRGDGFRCLHHFGLSPLRLPCRCE